LDAATDSGADTNCLDLRDWDLPLFDPDDRTRGDASELSRTARAADSIVLGTPVYHGMISSTLKNALDYLGKEEFAGKTVGLVVTAGGGSYGPTLEHLRTGVRSVHGWTLPHEIGIRNASNAFDERRIVDPGLEERIQKLGRMTVTYAGVGSPPK
jgi:NAD(P)H-dependent FMN reductase